MCRQQLVLLLLLCVFFFKVNQAIGGKIAHVILPVNAGKIYSTLNVTQAALCTY